MNILKELKYTESHEWVKFIDEKTVVVGLTDFAQDSLGGIVFVNMPEEGEEFMIDETFADVESVKAVSDVYSPVSGTVAKVNDEIMDSPELINNSPYDAWLVQFSEVSETVKLLTAEEYEKLVKEE
jgi:glycine cleavage system H protein